MSANPLRILLVGQHDFLGPTEKQALAFAGELVRRGHVVLFSLGGDPATAVQEGVNRLPQLRVQGHRFAGRRLERGAVEGAKSFQPDIVHALNPRVPTIAAARHLARATGAPVLVHFEDDEWQLPPLAPGSPLRSRIGWVARQMLCHLQPDLWWHSNRRTLAWVGHHGRALDALTPALAAEVRIRLGRPCTVIRPLAPSLDPGDPAPDVELPSAIAESALILFTGTLYPVYLEDVLIGLRAVAEVQRRGFDVAYVHPGRIHARIDPQRLAAAAGLRFGTAVFPGLLPFGSVCRLLRRADVLLQPGAPSEFNRLRLPAKLPPYLASGTPVITFATGVGELLQDRIEVLKTYTASPVELADRILEVLNDRELAERLSAGGQAAARRLFDPRTNTDALEAHYRAALAERRP